MIVLPKIIHLFARHLTNSLPLFLYLVELLKGSLDRLFLRIHQLAQLVDETLLGL